MYNKICTKCNLEKNINEFSINNRSKDGHAFCCKKCKRLYNKERYKKYGKQFYLKYKINRAAAMKKWRKKNPDYIKGWRNNNPEYDKEWYISNREKCKVSNQKWYNKNKYKSHAKAAVYRARKMNQIMNLSKLEYNEIKKIYELCIFINSVSINIKRHVDHIIPLSRGGLHHPDNLQILEARANLCKGSKILNV